MTRRKSFISMSDNSQDDSNTDHITSYCPKCESLGLKKLLGERIYKQNEPIPSDADNWLQCHHCGTITARVHAKRETKLKGFVEIPDTIYDSGKTTVIPVNSNKSRRSRIKREYRESDEDIINKDLDAQRMITQGKKLVNYTNIQNNNNQ